MKKALERNGGLVSIDEQLPDDLAERFLEEIFRTCPDCRAILGSQKIDQVLERDDLSETLGEH